MKRYCFVNIYTYKNKLGLGTIFSTAIQWTFRDVKSVDVCFDREFETFFIISESKTERLSIGIQVSVFVRLLYIRPFPFKKENMRFCDKKNQIFEFLFSTLIFYKTNKNVEVNKVNRKTIFYLVGESCNEPIHDFVELQLISIQFRTSSVFLEQHPPSFSATRRVWKIKKSLFTITFIVYIFETSKTTLQIQ